MLRLLRHVVTAVTAALVLASPAVADTTVEYNVATNDHGSGITITGDTLVATLADDLTIEQTPFNYKITRDGGGLITASPTTDCTGDGTAQVTCPTVQSISIDLAAGADKLRTVSVLTPLLIAGGDDGDDLQGGSGNDVLAGGAGNDKLNGGAGLDEYFGEGDNDTIVSRDGVAERISCGAGDNDQVDNDFTDIIAECERGTDTDGDGFSTAVDCDDANAKIFPGAPEVLDNGIDENCNGQDDRNLDRDGDRFPIPGDCNDANAKIHPGAREIRGNKVDENCDGRAEPYAVLASLVSTNWRLTSSFTLLRKLVVRNAPKGAHVSVTCNGPGCRFHKTKKVRVKRDLKPVFLHQYFRHGQLRPGARIKVTVIAAGTIGRTYLYRIERNTLPAAEITCRAPGVKKGRRC